MSHLKHAKKTTTATTFYSICTEDKKAHVSAVRHLRDETHKKVLEGKTACTKKKKITLMDLNSTQPYMGFTIMPFTH